MRVAVCTEPEDLLSNAEVEASCVLANHGVPTDYSLLGVGMLYLRHNSARSGGGSP